VEYQAYNCRGGEGKKVGGLLKAGQWYLKRPTEKRGNQARKRGAESRNFIFRQLFRVGWERIGFSVGRGGDHQSDPLTVSGGLSVC